MLPLPARILGVLRDILVPALPHLVLLLEHPVAALAAAPDPAVSLAPLVGVTAMHLRAGRDTGREGQRATGGGGGSTSRTYTPCGGRAHAAHLDLSALVIIRVLPVEALGLQRTAVQCHFKV